MKKISILGIVAALMCYFVTHADVITIKSKADFKKRVLDSGRPAIVKFSGDGCQPCQEVAGPFKAIAKKSNYSSIIFAEVNIDNGNMDLGKQYKISGVPTFIMFKDGQHEVICTDCYNREAFNITMPKDIEEYFGISATTTTSSSRTSSKPAKHTTKKEKHKNKKHRRTSYES